MASLHSIRRDLFARRHTALLLSIIALFAVRPFLGDTGVGAVAFSLALLAVVFVALFTILVDDMVGDRDMLVAQRRRRILIGCALAAPAIAERFWMFYSPTHGLFVAGSISWLIFFGYVTWNQLRSLLRQRQVTGETISLSISIYLLMGLCWAVLYIVIFTRHPESFSLQLGGGVGEEHAFPIFLYFSLTTLSTIGFGDITPLTLPSRYAAVAEGITGQFYLAILVARLVGMQMSQAVASPERPAASGGEAEKPHR
jgi:hypothetical protein